MNNPDPSKEQNHPLYLADRDHVDRLLAIDSPGDNDLVDLARLIIRYDDFPGASDLQEDMKKILKHWKLDLPQLNQLTLEIWEKGYRPGLQTDKKVGSGFDTADEDSN